MDVSAVLMGLLELCADAEKQLAKYVLNSSEFNLITAFVSWRGGTCEIGHLLSFISCECVCNI
jgi:hypothetical protein